MARIIFALLSAGFLLLALALFAVPYRAFVVLPARDAAGFEAARRTVVVTDTLTLQGIAPGERVVLEGQIDEKTPVTNFTIVQEYTEKRLPRPLVMYMVRGRDAKANAISVSHELSPPFTLNLVGGSVPIVNNDYIIISSWGYTTIDPVSPVQGIDVRGIGIGKVALIGTVVARGDGIGIEANSVTDKPVEQFITPQIDPDSRGWAQGFSMLVGLVGVVPLLLSVVFGVLGWRLGKRPAAKHAAQA